jgi:hypothetical protein
VVLPLTERSRQRIKVGQGVQRFIAIRPVAPIAVRFLSSMFSTRRGKTISALI